MTPLLMMPEGAEWLVILVIVVFVFGASKLPDLARSSGQALRIFKAEAKALREDDVKAKPLDGTEGRVEASAERTPDSGTPGV
ncbi:Sec-independent protein translocase subunit TatA [Nocardioides fonticola]|uniref:Sec-independent protein translocase protein TatA n=1 Tax=Nocardioides fonticola TaxID=450363 RepID=A0ABP7XU67_9ACTN